MKLDDLQWWKHSSLDCTTVYEHVYMDIRPESGGFRLVMQYENWETGAMDDLLALRQLLTSKAQAERVLEAVLHKGEINEALWEDLSGCNF